MQNLPIALTGQFYYTTGMKPHPQPENIPESMGPAEIGPHLRRLREQFKLTHQHVSERLHIRVRYIAAIEEANFEAMPGKIYARGYVHSYAEFLGLNPDQVAAQCFPSTAACAPAPAVAAKPSVSTVQPRLAPPAKKTSGGGFWAMMLVGAVGTLGVGYALQETPAQPKVDATQVVSGVAPIPESMLQSLRSEVMPTAGNSDCFANAAWLSCWFAQNSVKQLQQFDTEMLRPFADEIAAVKFAPLPSPEPDPAPAQTDDAVPDDAE